MIKKFLCILFLLSIITACKPDYAITSVNTTSITKIEYISKELPKRGIYKLCIDGYEYITILDREAVCITQVRDNDNKPKLCIIE